LWELPWQRQEPRQQRKGAVAIMPAPTDGMAADGSTCGSCHGSDMSRANSGGSTCGSCHGSDRSRGSSEACNRHHAGSHRVNGCRCQHLWELPWQRQEPRQQRRVQSPACRLPQIEWLPMSALVGAAMAATGAAAAAKPAIAIMPAPTDRMAGDGSICGSCHGSDRSRGSSRCAPSCAKPAAGARMQRGLQHPFDMHRRPGKLRVQTQ